MTKVQFYKTPAGNEVVLDLIRQLPVGDRRVFGEDIKVVELRHPVGMPLCRYLKGDLWELRSSLPSKREARLIYFFHGQSQAVVVLHGFIKTTRTTPASELKRADAKEGVQIGIYDGGRERFS